MRTSRLFVKISGDYKELDLYDNLTIPINYSVSEIRDISKRSTNYSLDFDLPNTEHNAELFEHIYKIEAYGGSLEMLRKYECVLQVNDTTVFEGYFQLKKVVTDDLKRVTYKGIFYSSVKDFVETLGSTTLRGNTNTADDLDFSEYSETASNMNLANFKAKLNSYGTGKTGYGLTLIDKTNKAGVSFANNSQTWYADELTPYLFVKEIWDKIFEQAGYSYESNFLTGASAPYGYPDFTSLIYPYPNNNKKLGDSDNWQKITAGGNFDWLSASYDMFLPHQWIFGNSGNYIDFPSTFTLTNHNIPDQSTHWQFTAPYTSSYHIKFKIPISLKCELHSYNYTDEQWNPQYTGAVTCGDTTKTFMMWTRLGKIHGSTTSYITSWGDTENFESNYTTGSDGRLLLQSQEISYEGDIRLEAGDKLFLSTSIQMEVAYYDQTFERWYSYLMYRGTGGWVSVFPKPAIVEMTQSAGVEIWSATQNEYFGEGLPFNPTLILNPKTKKWDFVNSIIKMFNLYIEDIGDRKFRIEPRDLYYGTGVKKDFTDKVDTSSMSFTRVDTYIYSDVNFKFAQDKDVMTEAYNGTYTLPYGEYVLEGALSSGQDSVDIKPIFGASMCGVVNAQTSVLQCPKMYAFKSNSDVVNVDKVYSDRIFYIWQNAMANRAGSNNTVLIKSRYSSATQTQNTYYCADILNAGYGADTQVLSWWDNEEYLENLGDGTVCNGNLYNRFYSKMLSELNDAEARILSCKMYLDATDIRNIRLSDTIVVNNVEYRINSIKQWEGYSKPTEVELIKIVRPTSSYTPSRGNSFLTSRLESNADLNIMKGATEAEDGLAGWVPTPEAGDENKFLRGDGTWQTVGGGGGSYTGVEPIEVVGTEISLNIGAGLEVEEHGNLQVNADHTTIGINNSGQIYANIPDIKVRHINYVDDVFDSKDFNYLDIDGNKDMTIIVREYSTQDNLYTFRYFRLDTSNPQEEHLYIFESDKEYLTYRDDNTWSIARKPFDVQRIRVGNVYVSPNDGIITLAAGSNVTLASSGSTITISSTGGGVSGIENITVGGTTVSPTSGSVSLTAGDNVTLTPSGSDITITADAGIEDITVGGTTVTPTSGSVELVAGSNVSITTSGSAITVSSDAGVTKLQAGNTDVSPLNGAVKLTAGSNVTLTPSGNEISISSDAGVTKLQAGNTDVSPLNGAVKFVAGTNVTLTPSGNQITVSSDAGVESVKVGITTVSPTSGSVELVAGSNVTLTTSGSAITVASDAGVTKLQAGSTDVSPVNGAVKLVAGNNVTLTPSNNQISISSDAGVTKMQVGSTDISPVNGAIKLVAGTNVTLSTSGNEITVSASGGSQGAFVGHLYYEDGAYQSKDFTYTDLSDDCVIVVAYEYTDDTCTRYDYLRPIASTEYTNDGVFILEGETYHLEYTSGDTFNLTFRKAVNAVAVDGVELPTHDLIGLASGDDVELTTGNSLGAPLVTIDLTATAKNAISDFVDTQNDAYIDYTLTAGSSALSGNWITNNTYTAKNTYNQTTGVGRFYLKPNVAIGGGSSTEYTPFGNTSVVKTLDFSHSGLVVIGRMAVYQSTGLTSVTFGHQVVELGMQAFYGCSSLATLSTWSGVQVVGTECFRGCSSLTSINTTNIVVLGKGAFAHCTGLTSVTLTSGVQCLGSGAFQGCTGITSLSIGALLGLSDNIFSGCTGLTSVNIPVGISYIGVSAFYNCSNLATVTLPITLTRVDLNAFNGIKSNAVITCNAVIPPYIANSAFRNATSFARPTTGNQVLKVPSMSLNLYKNFVNSSTYGYQTSGWSLQFQNANIQSI